MTKNSMILSAVGIGALTLATVGAASTARAVSYDNWYYAYRFDTAGLSTNNMIGANAGFCYLAQVKLEETDTGGEYAQCTVYKGATYWVLAAQLGGGDADVDCQAICINY